MFNITTPYDYKIINYIQPILCLNVCHFFESGGLSGKEKAGKKREIKSQCIDS
jgi:hypothetical protein